MSAITATTLAAAEHRPRPRWPLWKVLLTVHAPVTIVLVGLALLGPVTGVPLATLVRDPVQVARIPEYVGAISNIGALCWCVAAVACLLSSAVLRRFAGAAAARLLFWSGILTAALLVDDLFLIHDGVLARELHIGDKKIYTAYFVALIAYLVSFRRALLDREPHLLAIALSFFAISVLTDLLWHEPTTMRYLLEDGAKLLGIVTWMVMFLRIGYGELSRLVDRLPQ